VARRGLSLSGAMVAREAGPVKDEGQACQALGGRARPGLPVILLAPPEFPQWLRSRVRARGVHAGGEATPGGGKTGFGTGGVGHQSANISITI